MYIIKETESGVLVYMVQAIGWVSATTYFSHMCPKEVGLDQMQNHGKLTSDLTVIHYVAICSYLCVWVVNVCFYKFEKEFFACLCEY